MTQRRGNGLLADAYVPLILLAPSHADLMLDALRRSGIAAYAVPLEEDVLDPAGGRGDDPPTDHLYVDAEERGAAERVLGAELPGLGEAARVESGPPVGGDLLDGPPENVDPDAGPAETADEDEVWQDLVSRFYDEDDAAERRRVVWPDAENLSVPDEDDRPDLARVSGDILADPGDDEDAAAERARRAEAELEGHYEPPPPPPLLQGSRVGITAWFALLSGPALLLGSAFLGIALPNWLMFVMVVVFLSSFVVLILRMTETRPPGDHGPDDGAVV
jgi:hypothetical protein